MPENINVTYEVRKQSNGKFRVKAIKTYSNGGKKTRTVAKGLTHYDAHFECDSLNNQVTKKTK